MPVTLQDPPMTSSEKKFLSVLLGNSAPRTSDRSIPGMLCGPKARLWPLHTEHRGLTLPLPPVARSRRPTVLGTAVRF